MGRRYDKFLNVASSMSLNAWSNNSYVSSNEHEPLAMRNAKFSWTAPEKHRADHDFTLSAPLFEARQGELLAIVGKVASGKSSLCSALLGEMTRLEGEQTRPRRIAICLQDPFILNDTVRANILFGEEYDQTRYDEAVTCAALTRFVAQSCIFFYLCALLFM